MPVFSARNATVTFNNGQTFDASQIEWHPVEVPAREIDVLLWTANFTVINSRFNYRWFKWRFQRPEPRHNRRWRRRQAYKLKVAAGAFWKIAGPIEGYLEASGE